MSTPASVSFKMIGGDGREYGPVDTATLQQWAREGRLKADSQVWDSRAANWLRAGQVPELAVFFGAAAAPAPAPPLVPAGPPPDAASLTQQILQRGYTADIGRWFGDGWELFKNHLGFALGAFWLTFVVVMGANMIPCVGSLVGLIVQPVLICGLWLVLINRRRGLPAAVGQIFDGFRLFFLHSFLANLVTTIFMMLAALPGVIMLVVGGLTISVASGKPSMAMTQGSIAFLVIGILLVLLPVIYLAVSYMFALPLVADKRVDFWTAMETSRRVVGRHWFGLLLFAILSCVVASAGLAACVVGLIFTLPLGSCIFVAAYDSIFGERAGPS